MKQTKSFSTAHDNGDHFVAVYDHAAGSPNVYTVFVWRNGKTAKIIGREVDLNFAKKIIGYYPKKVPKEV